MGSLPYETDEALAFDMLLEYLQHGISSDTFRELSMLPASILYDGPIFRLTEGVLVDRVEYISELAPTYPVTVNTAYVVDLRDFYRANSTKEVPTVSRLVRINVWPNLSLTKRAS
jgi:hypothetical protein